MNIELYTCPCCGYKTLEECPPGTFEICPICHWEDDNVQFEEIPFMKVEQIEFLYTKHKEIL